MSMMHRASSEVPSHRNASALGFSGYHARGAPHGGNTIVVLFIARAAFESIVRLIATTLHLA